MPMTAREQYEQRWAALKTERSSWVSHWQDLSDHILPRSGRFFSSDRNRGERRHNAIYDSTATRALRVLAAGMMSGMTSPARPWFRLETDDPDMMAHHPVKVWCEQVTDLMLRVFQRSNTYRALHSLYEELGVFGTGASVVVPDFNTVIHHHTLTAGQFAVACDWAGHVTTLYREFDAPVGTLVKEFGRDRVSPTVRALWDRGNLDAWVTVMHAIEPRADRDETKRDQANMPWKSCYWETGNGSHDVLREGGFERFPALCPRWAVGGGDIYGSSPAMDCLGDVRQLQHQQLRKAQGIDYQVNPPIAVPQGMKGREVSRLPGGVTYYDPGAGAAGVKAAWDVRLDLSHLLVDIQDVRERIRGAFFSDLFLMLANDTDHRMTATEVAERHEEKMLMLGPVLERLSNELLMPLVDMTFDRMASAGVLPPPPEELQGHELGVELISILAQAQRAIGVNSIDRYTASLGAMAGLKPEVLDVLDEDRWAEVYAESLGIDPSIMRDRREVEALRAQRAQAAAAQQQMAAVQQLSGAARDLGSVDTTQPSALTDVMAGLQGY